jgi:sugar/nucleoside kinase (ribokinase family)
MDLPNVLRYVDVFLPNEVEALHLSGQKTLSAALNKKEKV